MCPTCIADVWKGLDARQRHVDTRVHYLRELVRDGHVKSRDGGFVGEGAEEPGRGEKAPIASGGGMRRSEEARVSEETVRRKGGGGGPRELGMG